MKVNTRTGCDDLLWFMDFAFHGLSANQSANLQVSNALEELLRWYDGLQLKKHIFKATQRCAGGIIEAIEHFALGPYEVPADRVLQSHKTLTTRSSSVKLTKGSATREVVDVNTALVMWVNGDSPNTDAAHNRILGVMVRVVETLILEIFRCVLVDVSQVQEYHWERRNVWQTGSPGLYGRSFRLELLLHISHTPGLGSVAYVEKLPPLKVGLF